MGLWVLGQTISRNKFVLVCIFSFNKGAPLLAVAQQVDPSDLTYSSSSAYLK